MHLPMSELLTYEELLRVINIAANLGMNKLRLTGGEPLVRRGVEDFIGELAQIKGLEDIRLTTNGVLLQEKAEALYASGIRRLNISLDTLQPERFLRITGRDLFSKVWQGIMTARDLGFKIKLNVVAMKGVNDDEFVDFAKLALQEPFQVRFIEFMPMGEKSSWEQERYISVEEIKKMLAELGSLEPFLGTRIKGPARVYTFTGRDGEVGRVGFISPISSHFCDQCNRLRLTSEGQLRSCLLNDQETDLKKILRQGGSDEDVKRAILETIKNKPKGHSLRKGQNLSDAQELVNCHGQMSRIGG